MTESKKPGEHSRVRPAAFDACGNSVIPPSQTQNARSALVRPGTHLAILVSIGEIYRDMLRPRTIHAWTLSRQSRGASSAPKGCKGHARLVFACEDANGLNNIIG